MKVPSILGTDGEVPSCHRRSLTPSEFPGGLQTSKRPGFNLTRLSKGGLNLSFWQVQGDLDQGSVFTVLLTVTVLQEADLKKSLDDIIAPWVAQ